MGPNANLLPTSVVSLPDVPFSMLLTSTPAVLLQNSSIHKTLTRTSNSFSKDSSLLNSHSSSPSSHNSSLPSSPNNNLPSSQANSTHNLLKINSLLKIPSNLPLDSNSLLSPNNNLLHSNNSNLPLSPSNLL